jgi:hypothetical protein
MLLTYTEEIYPKMRQWTRKRAVLDEDLAALDHAGSVAA